MTENYFETLAKINVKEHVEKKGKFNYLSWAWAVDKLRKAEPSATWEVIRFNGLPFLETSCGIFVEVAVTVKGITLSQLHPVLDGYNKPIAKPSSFQINTSIQRALVKAIALHGLGLYIYAGEDLPNNDDSKDDPDSKEEVKSNHKQLANIADGLGDDMSDLVKENKLDKANEFLKRIKIELEAASSVEKINEICDKNKKRLASLEEDYKDLFEVFNDCKEGMIQILTVGDEIYS